MGKANLDTEGEVLRQLGGSLLLFALFTYASDVGTSEDACDSWGCELLGKSLRLLPKFKR